MMSYTLCQHANKSLVWIPLLARYWHSLALSLSPLPCPSSASASSVFPVPVYPASEPSAKCDPSEMLRRSEAYMNLMLRGDLPATLRSLHASTLAVQSRYPTRLEGRDGEEEHEYERTAAWKKCRINEAIVMGIFGSYVFFSSLMFRFKGKDN
jgi:hypothetical protein